MEDSVEAVVQGKNEVLGTGGITDFIDSIKLDPGHFTFKLIDFIVCINFFRFRVRPTSLFFRPSPLIGGDTFRCQ